MKDLRKTLLLSLTVATLFTASGCGGGAASDKVYFASHTEATAFVGKVLEGIKKSSGSQGLDIEFVNANRDANAQIDQLNTAIAEKPAAIILLAVDGDALIPTVKKANDADIPVIVTNRDLNGGTFASVKSDDHQAGVLQGEYMAKHLPLGANVVYLRGEGGQGSTKARWEGFKEACLDKRKDVTLIASAYADWSGAEALKYMTLWLQVFPKIDGVICANDTMALGALRAVKDAGRTGVLIAGVDAKDEAVKSIAAGEMSMSAKQDAEKTAEAIGGLLSKIKGGDSPTEDILVPFTAITKDNLEKAK